MADHRRPALACRDDAVVLHTSSRHSMTSARPLGPRRSAALGVVLATCRTLMPHSDLAPFLWRLWRRSVLPSRLRGHAWHWSPRPRGRAPALPSCGSRGFELILSPRPPASPPSVVALFDQPSLFSLLSASAGGLATSMSHCSSVGVSTRSPTASPRTPSRFENPYSAANTEMFYGPGVVSGGRVQYGFPYLPAPLILDLPAHLVSDAVWMHLGGAGGGDDRGVAAGHGSSRQGRGRDVRVGAVDGIARGQQLGRAPSHRHVDSCRLGVWLGVGRGPLP